MKHSALIKLMHLVSPALPVGAYAYSQGQEYAVDSGWIRSEEQLQEWLSGLMRFGLSNLDLPVLARAHLAWQKNDLSSVIYWNDIIRANRETSELLMEDEQLGLALQRLLVSLGINNAKEDFLSPPSFVTMFALAGVKWSIPVEELLYGFVWSWLENQVAAATKSIPLGQTQGQKLLVLLSEHISPVVEQALSIEDENIGLGLPGLALSSARHERQYSRLFRS